MRLKTCFLNVAEGFRGFNSYRPKSHTLRALNYSFQVRHSGIILMMYLAQVDAVVDVIKS